MDRLKGIGSKTESLELLISRLTDALSEDRREVEALENRKELLLERIAETEKLLHECSSTKEEVRERIRSRADAPYFAGVSYRLNEKQRALLAFAAEKSRLSRQEMIENLLMPWLEEEFGEEFDELHPEWR